MVYWLPQTKIAEVPLGKDHQIVIAGVLQDELDHVLAALPRQVVGEQSHVSHGDVPGRAQKVFGSLPKAAFWPVLVEVVAEEGEDGNVVVQQSVASRGVEVAVDEDPGDVRARGQVVQTLVDVLRVPRLLESHLVPARSRIVRQTRDVVPLAQHEQSHACC